MSIKETIIYYYLHPLVLVAVVITYLVIWFAKREIK